MCGVESGDWRAVDNLDDNIPSSLLCLVYRSTVTMVNITQGHVSIIVIVRSHVSIKRVMNSQSLE